MAGWSPQFMRSRPLDFELIGDVVDVVFRAFPVDVLKRVAPLVAVDGLLDGFSQSQQVVCLLVGLHQAVEGDVGQSIDGSSEVRLGELVRLSLEGNLVQLAELLDENRFQHHPAAFSASQVECLGRREIPVADLLQKLQRRQVRDQIFEKF